MSDTRIIYALDTLTLQSRVIFIRSSDLENIIITEKTPFHPISYTWPDQPGDTGTISSEGKVLRITDSVIGAINSDGTFFLDKQIPIKRKEEGWTFFVCHMTPDAVDASLIGREVTLAVDKERRYALSLHHSACHLAALALNKAAKKYWQKDTLSDPLGNPDFDKLAIQESTISVDHSKDRYRLGKSLKKKGFNADEFFQNMPTIQDQINCILREWIATGGDIKNVAESDALSSNRFWVCSLPDGDVKFPCGGTHILSMKIYKMIFVSLTQLQEEPEIIMETIVSLKEKA